MTKTEKLAKRRAQLADAGRSLIRFARPFERGTFLGYVLDVGDEFFLLAVVDDNIRLNGYSCLRLTDIRRLRVPAKYETFVKTALRKRGERTPAKRSLTAKSLTRALSSASRIFPVVTVHREKIASDVCHIGKVVGLDEKRVSLLEIGPDAAWDKSPTIYKLREITRIDFGGSYEEALSLVGGLPNVPAT